MGEGCLPIPQEVGGLPEKVVYWLLVLLLLNPAASSKGLPVEEE